MRCPRCDGFIRAEPARLVCANCGGDSPRAATPTGRGIQYRIDAQMRPRSAESMAPSAMSWGPAKEHEDRRRRS